MANALYQKSRTKFLEGNLGWGGTIKVACVDSADYTPDLVNDEFLDIIDPVAIVATSPALTGVVALADGVADAEDVYITSVTGDPFEYLVIYKEGATDALSELIVLLDTVTGLPVSPNGTDINIVWDNGSNRMFKL